MNPELKAKWVEALRGGNYGQAQNVLRSANGFCCLGVLCDVIDPSKWTSDDEGSLYLGSRRYLPTEIERVEKVEKIGVLMGMNDDGKTFAEIADYIEINL